MIQRLKREQREEQILLSLKRCDYLSRSQIQHMHKLGSDRNARKVLANMSDYVSSFRDKEKVYYLNAGGRERVECNKVRKKSVQVGHYLMRNQLYIHLGQPNDWKNEVKLGFEGIGFIIADSFYQKDNVFYAVEIDHTQKMLKNRSKIDKYKAIIKHANFPIKIIWLTTTDYRKKQLEKLCDGVDAQVLLIDDIN
ncbi:hypothetical protein LQ50_07825 [Halalkalibacter okhensis]|uniref:Replication-relaxation n=2 Tax=Halalkalibacter okhensis TaxID=333138 RepID=A0A0B0IKV0_9BACI|nr:hypothetical protein LQ50_07825 [Halalkalibacter okhensis]